MHWFTADPHWWHSTIIPMAQRLEFLSLDEHKELMDLCGHKPGPPDRDKARSLTISQASIEKMNQTIIDRINARVSRSDILWILGDLMMARRPEDYEWLGRTLLWDIRCKDIRVIPGNHDRGKTWKVHPRLRMSLEEAKVRLYEGDHVIRPDGQRIHLSHYPLSTWEGRWKGGWNLHGHCHGRHIPIEASQQVDVGVDRWDFSPVSLSTIQSYFDSIPKASSPVTGLDV